MIGRSCVIYFRMQFIFNSCFFIVFIVFVFICFCFCFYLLLFYLLLFLLVYLFPWFFLFFFICLGFFLFWCFDLCLFSCPFYFGHCVFSSSTIYGFWLSLWYLKTLLFIFILKWITEEHGKNKNQRPIFPIVNFPFISSNNPKLTNKWSLSFTTRLRILGLVPSTVMFSTQSKLIR